MNRNGKIARLPAEILRELNHRLDRNEDGGTLLHWLNTRPEVRTVVDQDFNGAAISKQNLHEWRAGGFAEWRARRECFDQARELAADADDFNQSLPGRLADRLATVLTTRYAALLHHWNGEVTDELQKKLRVLHDLCRDVTCLRRAEQSAAQLALQEGWLEEERERRKREMLGLPPLPQEDDPSSSPTLTSPPPGDGDSVSPPPASPAPAPTPVQPGQTNPPPAPPTPPGPTQSNHLPPADLPPPEPELSAAPNPPPTPVLSPFSVLCQRDDG